MGLAASVAIMGEQSSSACEGNHGRDKHAQKLNLLERCATVLCHNTSKPSLLHIHTHHTFLLPDLTGGMLPAHEEPDLLDIIGVFLREGLVEHICHVPSRGVAGLLCHAPFCAPVCVCVCACG